LLKDITATIQLESQLLQSQKMEALGTLAGGVAHEFNNVLTAIKGYTQLMAIDKEMPESLRELLDKIDEATGRARDLTRKLLTFSRIESGVKTAVDINTVVNTVVDLILHTFPRNIKVQLNLDKDIGIISANSTQLEQVVLNLSLNAKDAMPDGGELTFTTAPRRLDESFCRVNPWATPGHYVVLSVADAGSGIAPHDVTRIFEPFYTTKEAEKGTGLGLSVAYSIIRSHSGGILVDSRPANGTRFDLFFPIQEVPVEEVPDETISAPFIKGQGEHVLVVDDEDAVREVTRSALENFGYQVDEATNGAEALKAVQMARDADRPYHLILLDLAMPIMDGRECYHRLINQDAPPRILIATGHLSDRETFEEKFPQAMGLLQKPFDLRTLLDEVHKTLVEPAN
jgi:two-component system cell cycle sensor histidine kinase/response regulator CckA